MVDATVSLFVVSFVLEKLSNFLKQEDNIRIEVKGALTWLKDELGYLQSWVEDAQGKQETDPLIALWINRIRDVATDAEIILERITVIQKEHAAKNQSVMDRQWSFICMCNKEANLYKIGKEIELLNGRVVEIKKRLNLYNIYDILADPNLRKRKRTILLRETSFENQVDVVGFDDDYRILLTELVRKDPTLNVICIHGIGGLGKTTIARKLYNSIELSQFQSRAWVCVSKDYNIKDVLRKIIKSFMGHEVDLLNKMDEVELMRKLQNLLQDRGPYLAVIDDVWDINVWEKIKKAFSDKKNGSRMIITTRNKGISRRVDDRCFVHQLRFLTDDESWILFYKRAKPTKNQEKLGKKMVSKCRGLPLAIVVLSGLLLHKNWEDVEDHLWRKWKWGSMEIQEILSLSYNDLSFRMKQCFLYLSRFPEDCQFYVKDLMLLWIAEDFITEADEGDGIVMEDLAKDYLHELLNRNMIQVEVMGLDGEVLECRMHDLVRDVAIQKAKENKLLGIFDSTKVSESPNNLLQGQPRHAIYERIGEYLKSIMPSSDDLWLRSLAVVETGFNVYGLIELEEMQLMFTRFMYLKVLDLRYVKSGIIPEEIGDLVFLKFLGLVAGGGDDYDYGKGLVIPPTIGKLKMLQTLCHSLDKHTKYNYPREIYKLEELRHLNIWKYEGNLSIDSSHQTKLQTLYFVSSKDWIMIDNVNFSNLHTLGLLISRNADNSLDSLANLISLQTLYLSCTRAHVMPTMKPLLYCKCLKSLSLTGAMIDPSELLSIPSLTYLGLFYCKLTQDPMPTLERLSNLTTLILCKLTYGGKKMICSNDGFPGLQFLLLQELYDLEELKVEEGALSSLKGLTIENCGKLTMVSSERVKCIPRIPALYSFL